MNLNTKLAVIVISFIVVFVILFILWHYVYNIYEVSYNLSSRNLYADNKSTVRINAVPINALGFKAPGRKVEAEFYLTEGKDLVEIMSYRPDIGIIELRALDKAGTVTIQMKSKFILMPTLIEITILSNTAENISG